MFNKDDIIFSYTRAQAIADGVLYAVPDGIRKEAGFRVPVALSERAYRDCVEWTEADTERHQVAQDHEGRLWDVLAMARFAAIGKPASSRIEFDLLRVPRQGSGHTARRVRLVSMIHEGDAGEPVITIMFPDDD